MEFGFKSLIITSGQRILTRGRITGKGFFIGNLDREQTLCVPDVFTPVTLTFDLLLDYRSDHCIIRHYKLVSIGTAFKIFANRGRDKNDSYTSNDGNRPVMMSRVTCRWARRTQRCRNSWI